MRWSNLLTDPTAEQTTLPGYREAATVRHFDAPEALSTRFYEVRAKSVLNRVPERSQMPFRWTVNPYRGCSHACSYCFARPTHTYLGMDAGRDFEKEIVVKVNAPEVLAAELAKPSWPREHVAMGTNTDPYQWVEGRYRLMRGIWAALRDARTPCSVLTKSPLLLRDLDLLQELAAVTDVSANLSIPSLDERAWRSTEPHTPSPRARFEAVKALNDAGIPTGILVAPLMPGINDDPRQVEAILDAAVEAGATSVGGIALHLRGETRDVWFDWLRQARPDLVPRYEQLYARGAYAPAAERERLAQLLREGKAARPQLRSFSRQAKGPWAAGAVPGAEGARHTSSDAPRAAAEHRAASARAAEAGRATTEPLQLTVSAQRREPVAGDLVHDTARARCGTAPAGDDGPGVTDAAGGVPPGRTPLPCEPHLLDREDGRGGWLPAGVAPRAGGAGGRATPPDGARRAGQAGASHARRAGSRDRPGREAPEKPLQDALF